MLDPNWLSSLPYWSDLPAGWHTLVEELLADLDTLGFDRASVEQVKEKYAGLRFYCAPTSEACQARIDLAEAASKTICQFCGDPGKTTLYGKYWLMTTCPACDEREAGLLRFGAPS